MAQLDGLDRLFQEQGKALEQALWADLRKSATEAQITETGSTYAELALARKSLKKWMKPRKLSLPMQIKPASADLVPEPLGVVLIIAPWNYPVNLLLSPLIGALAAGNTVALKPSELTPHVSQVIADLLPRYLDPDAVKVVQGGPEETQALLAGRFDHILYTGNGKVARIVAEAAAKHLTPTTLELGGKSPVWVDDREHLEQVARRLTWAKWTNAGQTCVAPDYVMTLPELVGPLTEALRAQVLSAYGVDPAASPDYPRVVNGRHHARLVGYLEGALVAFGGRHDAEDRYLDPTVVQFSSLAVAADAPVMKEEIFGPILPIIATPSVDAAIEFVNDRDKPLALYVFSDDEATQQRFIDETSSGAIGLDVAMVQAGLEGVPFGGVGESGMGAYRFHYSFDLFSHLKPVVRKPFVLDTLKFVAPPFTAAKQKMAAKLAKQSVAK